MTAPLSNLPKPTIVSTNEKAKPFLKWAGGKSHLVPTIFDNLPEEIYNRPFTYVEPFLGSGAVLFKMIEKFPLIKKILVNDANKELIDTYRTIVDSPDNLIEILSNLEQKYHSFEINDPLRKEYYYRIRSEYNSKSLEQLTQSAYFIFLNRTCFNGLYRVNSKNEFNVPMGSYNKPTICDSSNLLSVSNALKNVAFIKGDFESILGEIEGFSFIYLDPPYKPLSETSSFTSYTRLDFNDNDQERLYLFCKSLHEANHRWILSNSDLRGKDSKNMYFDNLYKEFSIIRVNSKRRINANPAKRGTLTELLIRNY